MDPAFWHRFQFAFTITYHYLFPQLTMGLALLILVMQEARLRQRMVHFSEPASQETLSELAGRVNSAIAGKTSDEVRTIWDSGGVTGPLADAVIVTDGQLPQRFDSRSVTANFFAVLGTTPFQGRLFGESDARPDAAATAVVSYALARREYGSAPAAIGQTVSLNRRVHTVIGVLPPGLRYLTAADVYLLLEPQVLVCDEPTSALDSSMRSQILNLLASLKKRYNLTLVVISHDLRVVHYLCDRVAVMYLGRIVEVAESEELFQNPRHPYTRSLINASMLEEKGLEGCAMARGEPPSPLAPPPGCSFHPRCPIARPECTRALPELIAISDGHQVRCPYHAAESQESGPVTLTAMAAAGP